MRTGVYHARLYFLPKYITHLLPPPARSFSRLLVWAVLPVSCFVGLRSRCLYAVLRVRADDNVITLCMSITIQFDLNLTGSFDCHVHRAIATLCGHRTRSMATEHVLPSVKLADYACVCMSWHVEA